MDLDELSVEGLRRRLAELVGEVQLAFRREMGVTYDDRLIADAMAHCLAHKLDRIEEGMLEMFTTPRRAEYHELTMLLERHAPEVRTAIEIEEAAHLAQEYGDESVFTGHRTFSPSKYAAMMSYLTSKGHYVYKTSLNKLLFYTDLTYYYLSGKGMSGAVYANRPYGPVAEPAGPLLNALIERGEIVVDPRMKTLTASDTAATDMLNEDERKVLDWVAETYGGMKAGEISGFSHNEHAYKFTEPNELIAYDYAKVFKKLPPRDFLG